MIGSLLAATILVAAPPPGSWAYSDGDLRVRSPGSGWESQTVVPGAPNIRVAFVRVRSKDRGSVIDLAIDGTPDLAKPLDYVKRTLGQLAAPPLGFKVTKTGEFTWKGNPAARAEYTDATGKKRFAQATIKTPRGGFLLVTLISPDAQSYAEDQKVFFAFLEGIEVAPPDPPKKGKP